MPRFLSTTGQPTAGLGICDRCARKFPLAELRSDPNIPGLKVCEKDRDELNGDLMPLRPTETISLRFVRPDVDLATSVPDLLNPGNSTETVAGGGTYPAP